MCVLKNVVLLFSTSGVEDAFSFTSKVMTVSFHKYSPGFFPGRSAFLSVLITAFSFIRHFYDLWLFSKGREM